MSDKPIKVLLIEDNPGDARLIQELLSEANMAYFQVEMAKRLSDGLEALSARRFDVVLLDLSLPDSSGLETLAKTYSKAQQVAVIVLTGLADKDLAVEAVRKGAQDYLVKGQIDENLLSRAILYAIERKQAEEALKESEEKYRTILENIEDAYYEVDNAGSFTFFNDSLCKISGYTKDELMGMNNRQYIDQENAKKIYQTFNKVYNTGKPDKGFDYEFIKKDGTKGHANASVSLIKDAEGQRIGFRGIIRDITQRKQAEEERKKLESQLRQAQKMEAVGRLAGGVAHDFSNLLMTIVGNADLLLMKLHEEDPLRNEAKEIKDTGKRAASLIRQLLVFSRKQVLKPRALDLNKVITDMMKLLKRLIREDVEFEMVPYSDLMQVECDPRQIEQVIMNLAINARDAMPQGGELTIATTNVDLDETYAREHGVELKAGPYVMIAVSDTGIGMDEETRPLIFEPFFTTKEEGKGTGLGLSTVYGIIKQTGGYIWVYSEPGQGTTFKIYLPAIEKDMGEVQEKRAPNNLPKGSETVLLVDDDEPVRKLARSALQERGYRVLEAHQGEEALRISKRYEGPIHLLLTDVVMPEIGGREVAERLQSMRPETKVLYISGYADNTIAQHGILAPGVKFLEKPFSMEVLARKVREVLAE